MVSDYDRTDATGAADQGRPFDPAGEFGPMPADWQAGATRRDFLRLGTAGLFGMGITLPGLLQCQARAAEQGRATSDVSTLSSNARLGRTASTSPSPRTKQRSSRTLGWVTGPPIPFFIAS